MCSLLHVIGVTMLMITTAQCLRCAPVGSVNCTAKDIVEKGCPQGVAKDICNRCWICCKVYNEECGGLWNMGGTCAEGLRCSNPWTGEVDINNQMPGICCRNATPMIGTPLARPACRNGFIRNPCSGLFQCKKAYGEICGGPGDIYGVCAVNLVCYPPLSDATHDIDSTCTSQDEIPSTTTITVVT